VAHHQKRSLGVALVGAICGLLGTYVAYLLLGFFTGVVAMCATAPEWWMHLYFPLAFAVIPAGSAWVAIAWRRAYLRRHEKAGA
jgi:xanthosine utilization system XapX-like protein